MRKKEWGDEALKSWSIESATERERRENWPLLQLNSDFIMWFGGWGVCGSSKTHNFLQSENQILKMTGLISVLSELRSRREGGAGGLSATICQGELETIRAEWKGRWLLLSGGALWAGYPDVAVHIKEQEASSLIQETCQEWRAIPQLGGGLGEREHKGDGTSCSLICWKFVY